MRILREESGQALIEFALSLSLFVLVLAGIVDYSIYVRDRMELTEAAAAAAAYGTTRGAQKSSNWSTTIAIMQGIGSAAAPDVKNVTVTASYFYTCTPGGAHVTSGVVCTRSNYTTPLMYVSVQTSATVPATLKWAQLSSSLSLQGSSTYRVPWTQ